MKTIGTKWPLGITIKKLFKGKDSKADSTSAEAVEPVRLSHKQRNETFEREIQMEIKRAEAMELRRLMMIVVAFFVFASAQHDTSIHPSIATGKEVIVS